MENIVRSAAIWAAVMTVMTVVLVAACLASQAPDDVRLAAGIAWAIAAAASYGAMLAWHGDAD